jgi:hypothetical protein
MQSELHGTCQRVAPHGFCLKVECFASTGASATIVLVALFAGWLNQSSKSEYEERLHEPGADLQPALRYRHENSTTTAAWRFGLRV